MKTRIQRPRPKNAAVTNASVAAGRGLVTWLIVALVASMAALLAPPATATASHQPAAAPGTSAVAPTGQGGNGDDSVPRTERWKIIMRKVYKDHYLLKLDATYGALWEPIDLPPAMRARFEEIFKENWGSGEENVAEFEVIDRQEMEGTPLYQELVAKNGSIGSAGFVLQGVGRNPSWGVHAERILSRGIAKGKYIEQVLKSKNPSTAQEWARVKASIKKDLRRFTEEVSGMKPTDYYAKITAGDFAIGKVVVGPVTLPPGSVVTRQPCGSGNGGGCSAIGKAADFGASFAGAATQGASDGMVAVAYGEGLTQMIADALESAGGGQAQATDYANSLIDLAKALATEYDFHRPPDPAVKAILRQGVARLDAALEKEEIALLVKGRTELAKEVHSARVKIDVAHDLKRFNNEDMQKLVNKEKEALAEEAATQNAENLGLKTKNTKTNAKKPTAEQCSPAVGAPAAPAEAGGGRVPAMAAMPMAAACSRTSSSGLARAFSSNNYGGVDFSTLEMRYMSDPGAGGVRYSFSGRQNSSGAAQDVQTGLDAVTNSTADLRTWLALNPNEFWVNLNPSEPDRIVDPALGRTNAGRALLEADFQMKRTEGRLLNPDTDLGARYWKALLDTTKNQCYSSRMWIVPGDVQVREDGSSLYILKATLAVKAKAEHIETGGRLSCAYDPAIEARGERLEQAMVVPRIADAVNNAPEYAPIRRAFIARIVAQWIRDRHRQGHRTSFDGLIDSGNVGPAALKNGWRPRQVFDAYVHSVREGEFTYHQTVRQGGSVIRRTFTIGGVDFSNLSMGRIGAAQMTRQHPRLAQTIKASADDPASAADGSIWLGDSAGSADNGLWSRTTGTIGAFATGRAGLLVLLLVALGVVTFGIRGPRRRRRVS